MPPDLQIWHVWVSSFGSERLHRLHIMPSFLTVSQTWQNFATSSGCVISWLASLLAMSFSIVWISCVWSILRTAPLTWVVYLLMAVWVMPRSTATSTCLML